MRLPPDAGREVTPRLPQRLEDRRKGVSTGMPKRQRYHHWREAARSSHSRAVLQTARKLSRFVVCRDRRTPRVSIKETRVAHAAIITGIHLHAGCRGHRQDVRDNRTIPNPNPLRLTAERRRVRESKAAQIVLQTVGVKQAQSSTPVAPSI